MSVLRLQSNDGVVFVVDVEVVKCSRTLETMLDTLGMTDDDEKVPIPLPVIHSVVLEKIIQWALHHKKAASHDENNPNCYPITSNLCLWDTEFFNKLDDKMLFDILQAANYLDIKPLLESACKFIANQMEDMTIEQLREKFGIPNDLTPEEVRRINKFGIEILEKNLFIT